MRDAVGAWMDAAGRYPLLTAAEELHLGAMVQAWHQWPGGPEAVPAPVRGPGRGLVQHWTLSKNRDGRDLDGGLVISRNDTR